MRFQGIIYVKNALKIAISNRMCKLTFRLTLLKCFECFLITFLVLQLLVKNIWPTDIWLTDIWLTVFWPTYIWPTNIWLADIWPTYICPTYIWPTNIWQTYLWLTGIWLTGIWLTVIWLTVIQKGHYTNRVFVWQSSDPVIILRDFSMKYFAETAIAMVYTTVDWLTSLFFTVSTKCLAEKCFWMKRRVTRIFVASCPCTQLDKRFNQVLRCANRATLLKNL